MDVFVAHALHSLLDHRGDDRVVRVVEAGEEMVLDLVVETAVHHRELGARHVRRGLHLALHEGGVARQAPLGSHAPHALKVVRDEEEEGEVKGPRANGRREAQQCPQGGLKEERESDEARPEGELEEDGGGVHAPRELGDALALPPPGKELDGVEEEELETVGGLPRQDIDVLQQVPGQPAVCGLEAQHAVGFLVRVLVHVVSVQVVHDHVLLEPEDHVTADPVLGEAAGKVDPCLAR
mmetsp:Transcript_11733/g.31578  ORF Transcript_11733/g.31578 Transcript_11733/m.31578 type:complete len:238 (+) Transcript_11733:619-1332(+)